jgi:2-hydroxychromene-2-carboxylate isomerase
VFVDAPVVFYYDFNSPCAYLVAERIGDLIPDAERKPIAFAILLGELGRLEGVLEELEAAPIAAEIAERAGDRGLPPFAPPEAWPVETWSLVPLRAALVADERGRLERPGRDAAGATRVAADACSSSGGSTYGSVALAFASR